MEQSKFVSSFNQVVSDVCLFFAFLLLIK